MTSKSGTRVPIKIGESYPDHEKRLDELFAHPLVNAKAKEDWALIKFELHYLRNLRRLWK